jgi:hypothetical protein
MRAFAVVIALLISFVAGLASPARAGDADVATAQTIIRAQEQAFAHDDANVAYSYAAPAIHAQFPDADEFMAMVRHGYVPVYRHKSFEFGEGRAADGRIAQTVRIIDADGNPWDALYTLEQEADGSWKITGCVLKAVGEAA